MSGTLSLPIATYYNFGTGPSSLNTTIVGTDGNDQLGGARTIYGLGGDDVIYGPDGGDFLYGGDGNDILYGGNGTNLLDGGNGDNVIYGGAGNDTMVVGIGDNQLYGAAGSNTAVMPELINQASVNLNYGSPIVTGPIGTETMHSVGTLRFLDGTLSTDTGSDLAQAYRMYQAAFDRAPDTAGLAYWTAQLDAGTPLATMAQDFLGSPEFQATYGALSDGDFVAALYQNVLGRAPDAAGAAFWQQALAGGTSRAGVLVGFSESTENVANTAAPFATGLFVPSENAIEVLAAYQTVLGHAPDAGSLASTITQVANGLTETGLAADLIGSTEFQANPAVQSNAGFVTQIVSNTEGAADPAGTAFWTAQLNAGTVTRADVAAAYATTPAATASVLPLVQAHGFNV